MNTNKSNECVINKICHNSVCNNCNRERQTAEWIVADRGGTTMWYECSACGSAGDKWDKFCKHCGARMTNAVAE